MRCDRLICIEYTLRTTVDVKSIFNKKEEKTNNRRLYLPGRRNKATAIVDAEQPLGFVAQRVHEAGVGALIGVHRPNGQHGRTGGHVLGHRRHVLGQLEAGIVVVLVLDGHRDVARAVEPVRGTMVLGHDLQVETRVTLTIQWSCRQFAGSGVDAELVAEVATCCDEPKIIECRLEQ